MATPFAEGTDSTGGYLVRDTFGQTLLDAVQRESAVLSLARVERVPGKKQRYTIYSGRPTAAFVGEGAAKPVTGASFSELSINVKKIATNVIYTQEMIEDAIQDPSLFVNPDVEAAFSDLIDSHALGKTAASGTGGNVTTSFDSMLRSTTSSVELGAGGDAIAKAISQALTIVESNGYKPNGIILASDGRGSLRDARNTVETAMPVYTNGFEREPDSIYGQQIRYSTNLSPFSQTAGANKIVGFVGDFSQCIAALRSDIVVNQSRDATIVDGGTTHNLFQENKVAIQWESRIGFNIHDINKSIVAIKDAS